jgi:hypothetical protein
MRGLIAGILALSVAPAGAVGNDEAANHCHSKETNQQWEELAAENHGSDAIQRLYALRLGLCVQVERGALTVPRATTIFERQREEVIHRIKQQEGTGPQGA